MSRGQELRQVARDHGIDGALQRFHAGSSGQPGPVAELLWLRLGSSERLRDATVAHLRGRRSGDTTVLLQQMVRGQLAEALGEQLELELAIEALAGLASAEPPMDAQPSDPVVRRLHRRITDTDRALLRCYGAAGFLADGVGGDAMVSETLQEVG